MIDIGNQHQSVRLRLREFRQHLKLNQGEFGALLGLDQTQVSAMEKGKSDLTIKTLYALVKLDCNPMWLLLGQSPVQLSAATNPPATVEVRERAQHVEYIIQVPKP
ncbi:transcriptional regulator with XRE-family HTH domain [Spirosoma lacussanchae]|uniref:helix-turn-helix domain-containing protein n=1 Tax=Spirosoma lacussanchae TaxID=1884249 RepID=UPI00110843ED|nr:helix-turn-helix transcriptional regulator [Spirosoma lacussanchae]